MPKGNLIGRTSPSAPDPYWHPAEEGGYQTSVHRKGIQQDEIPYSDYSGTMTPQGRERLHDIFKNMPELQEALGGDASYNAIQGFVESPEGAAMYDVWKQTGDPAPFLQRFQMFGTQSYTVPPDLME